jgi:hypothetical protein
VNQLLLIVLLGAVLWVGAVAGVVALTVVVVRRVAGLLRASARAGAREVTERARLRLTAQGVAVPGAGPQAEAARLRYELRDTLADARRTVAAAQASGWPVGDAPSLVRRLDRVAADLDTQLRLLALDRRPGPSVQPFDDLRSRVDTVVAACTDLRASLRHQAVALADDELRQLHEDCRIEAEALRARPVDRSP